MGCKGDRKQMLITTVELLSLFLITIFVDRKKHFSNHYTQKEMAILDPIFPVVPYPVEKGEAC